MNLVDANGIAVIGGGVIGVTSALALQLAGHPTLLLEKDEPGRGCSYGNAGVIATSFVLPLSSPRHILAAPRMLLNPMGPLAIRFSHLPAVAPWLARFLINASPGRQRRTIEGLQQLNARSLPAWQNLLEGVAERRLLIERGMLDVAGNPGALTSLRASGDRLCAAGVSISELDAKEVGEIEPLLLGRVAGGLLHHNVAHVEDPYVLTRTLLSKFLEIGGKLQITDVRALTPNEDGVQIDCVSGSIVANRALVAAGQASARLLAGLGVNVPLGVEHGYHLMVPHPCEMPSRPLSFHSESFLATPMRDGLRLAGTVELARSDASPNWKRADRLLDLAQPYLPGLTRKGTTRWMGGRPSFPDSLPAIGRLAATPRILYAFGHQHLGLTLAAITADIVRAMVADRPLPLSLEPFSLERFSRGVPTGGLQLNEERVYDFPQ